MAVSLKSETLAEICEVRAALEELASRFAASGRSEIALLTLEDITSRWRIAVDTGASDQQFVRLNNAFHETVWEASGNRYLVEQLKLLRSHIDLARETTLSTPVRQAEALLDTKTYYRQSRTATQSRLRAPRACILERLWHYGLRGIKPNAAKQ